MEEKINFDFIENLQYLVRDEISTREAAKRNNETLSTNIINKTKEIYSNKIKILSKESFQKDLKITKFELDEENNIFKKNAIMKQTIDAFFMCLRKDPEIIFKILTGLTTNEVKQISYFIMNNFYENILSPYKTEDELLSLIYRLLQLEINFLKSKNDFNSFLGNKTCGILLKQLCNRIEVKEFFGMVLEDILSRIENQNENEWSFSIENLKLKRTTNLLVPETFSSQKENLNSKFFKDYFCMFQKKLIKDLEEKLENPDLKTYYEYILSKFTDNNKDCFSNESLINLIYEEEDSEELLNEYIYIFYNVKQTITLILNNLIENINNIPYSLKCICKMISILIKAKFPDINIVEESIFINQFLFLTIFKTIFFEPDIKGLISSFIISQHTRDKILFVSNILEVLVSFNLFNCNDNKDMTPFNWFFVKEGIPKIFELTKKITNISFSNYINKLISGEIADNDFFYDYFTENPNSKRVQYTICYQPKEFYILLNILQNFDKSFFIPVQNQTQTLDNNTSKNKLQVNRRVLSNLISKFTIKTNINFVEQIFIKSNNYLLVTKTEISPQFSHLANFEDRLKPYKINVKKLEEGLKKNLLIIENYICELLFRFPPLDKRDFSIEEFSFLDFLEEIKKFGNIKDDMSIPFEWYCEILFYLLKNLPEEYQKDNYSKLLNMIKNDLNSSIELYKKHSFDWHSYESVSRDLLNKLKMNINALDEINDNKIIMTQIKSVKFPINMYCTISKNFDIYEGNIQNLTPRNQNKFTKCNNINDFINYFPDFVSYASKNKTSPYELEIECKASTVINKYIGVLIKNMLILNEEKFKKYIYSSLYSKMALSTILDDDLLLYQKCISLTWVEMSNIEPKKPYFFYSNLLSDATKLFSDLDNENSPMGKIKAINNIETLIYKVLIFNGIEIPGEDDKTPLRLFLFIKSAPKKFISSVNYLKCIDEENYIQYLNNYIGIQETLISDSIEFEGISKEEFQSRCAKSIEKWCNTDE